MMVLCNSKNGLVLIYDKIGANLKASFTTAELKLLLTMSKRKNVDPE